LNFLNLRGRFPLEKYQSTDAKYEQRLNGIRTKPDVASRTSSCDRRSPMNTRPEINMEAFLDARSDTNTFDDLVDDQYTEDLAFEADDSIDEEDDATENIEEDENQSKTSMLPIAGSVLRAGPRAQDDQEILFRELMRYHKTRLYRFVIRYIDHPDDAADITQQAFAEAARTISTFRGDSKLSTWLYGIAMNMVRNYMRKLIEQDLYELPVLSYQELTPEVNIQPLARVEI
jgi:hypothetical protein